MIKGSKKGVRWYQEMRKGCAEIPEDEWKKKRKDGYNEKTEVGQLRKKRRLNDTTLNSRI